MDDIFYNKIKNLINTINLKKINFKLIKTNVKKLLVIFDELSKLWKHINLDKIEYRIYSNTTDKFKQCVELLNKNFISTNPDIKSFIDKTKFIHYLNLENIHFYWLSDIGEKNFSSHAYLMGLNMFKISLSLNKYKFNNDDKIERKIIWIPVDKKRDYKYDKFSKINLKKATDNFEAFVASGVTFGLDPKITIITRYEEVEKLLIHELIHNFNIDGSGFHDYLDEILSDYKIIKTDGNYHYEYSIYESYTELLSTYFYLLYKNIIDKIDYKKIKNKLERQIILEIIYSYNLISNLIKMNGINDYDSFANKKVFIGDICIYEYYYLKALMYNNFVISFGSSLDDFKKIYISILKMIKKNNLNDDTLMKEIFDNCQIQYNYKYQLH